MWREWTADVRRRRSRRPRDRLRRRRRIGAGRARARLAARVSRGRAVVIDVADSGRGTLAREPRRPSGDRRALRHARRHAGERDLELDRAALRDRPRLRHARQRGEGRALPPPLRRAGAPAGGRLPLRHRLVLPAEEEVDQGAALVRPRARSFPTYHLCLFRRGYCLEKLHRPREAADALAARARPSGTRRGPSSASAAAASRCRCSSISRACCATSGEFEAAAEALDACRALDRDSDPPAIRAEHTARLPRRAAPAPRRPRRRARALRGGTRSRPHLELHLGTPRPRARAARRARRGRGRLPPRRQPAARRLRATSRSDASTCT